MRASASKRVTTSTGTLTKNAVQAVSPSRNSGIQSRSSGSRVRKRMPRRAPTSSSDCGSGSGSRDERDEQRGRDEVRAAVHDERPRRRDERDEDRRR